MATDVLHRRAGPALFLAAVLTTPSVGQVPEAAVDDVVETDLGWPRVHVLEEGRVVVHQPQIERWTNFEEIAASAAVEVTLDGATTPELGSIKIVASTVVDVDARQVLFGRPKLRGMLFPDTPPDIYTTVRTLVERVVSPTKPIVMSLDEVVAYLDPERLGITETHVSFDPPPIHYRSEPAILVVLMGPVRLERVPEVELLFAVNTNWDLFLNPTERAYYLLDGESWLTTRDLDRGPWRPAQALPIALSALPNDANWDEVREHVPGRPHARMPDVIVSHTPAELIVTDGAPQIEPIADTRLGVVRNTDRDLFRDEADGAYYFLTAGRWFRAASLNGPWSAATADLPADFAQIPFDHPSAHVLASVPGTTEAIAAIVLASIPRKMTVELGSLSPDISYQGEPVFIGIDGADGVAFALNAEYDVFRVDGLYYACLDGIWFWSKTPSGPWSVSTSVPDAIYTIPPTSDKYYATYVKVYDATAETVTLGQTGGYTGELVAAGLLVFGLGYAISQADEVTFFLSTSGSLRYPSYGCGARYDAMRGRYFRAATRYGPYGGAGRWASYDPRIGRYTRGAYRYGPRGAVTARSTYNPYRGRYGASVGAATPYASWRRGVVANDQGDWARAGYRAGRRGATAAVETSGGDLYVARNGRLYRRDDEGNWQGREKGNWNGAASDRSDHAKQMKQLRRDASARRVGQQRARRYGRGRR